MIQEEQQRRMAFLNEIDDSVKAAFINGEVVIHSPSRLEHLMTSNLIMSILLGYVRKHQRGMLFSEKAMISLTRNVYEPGLCFFKQEKFERFSPGQKRFPAPDLIVEILSDSTEGRDRGIQFRDYAAHGLTEYWIVTADEKTSRQYFLAPDNKYQLNLNSATGDPISRAMLNFRFPVQAFFDEALNMDAFAAMMAQ